MERGKCEERDTLRGRQRVKDKMEGRQRGAMADWVTSLLTVTGQCCIAGTRTKPSREEEGEEEEGKKEEERDKMKGKMGERSVREIL